jgi:hypothetical protein
MPERAPAPPVPRDQRRTALSWALADVAMILLFAASGRRTHEHGMSIPGVLETAWPFLLAYAIAYVSFRSWRFSSDVWPGAVLLWLNTAVGGLIIRAASGAGVAFSFQVVTVLVLGALLLLPRVVVHSFHRRNRTER